MAGGFLRGSLTNNRTTGGPSEAGKRFLPNAVCRMKERAAGGMLARKFER